LALLLLAAWSSHGQITQEVGSMLQTIDQLPMLSSLSLYLSLPYFNDFVQLLNQTTTDQITLFAPANYGVERFLSAEEQYFRKMGKTRPEYLAKLIAEKALKKQWLVWIGELQTMEMGMERAAKLSLYKQAFADFYMSEIKPTGTGIRVLRANLAYHLLPGLLWSTDIKRFTVVKTMLVDPMFVKLQHGEAQKLIIEKSKVGKGIELRFGNPMWSLYKARVLVSDIECTNGIIHIIDSCLLFPHNVSTITDAPGTSLGRSIVKAQNLMQLIGKQRSVTMVVPLDFALTKVLDIVNGVARIKPNLSFSFSELLSAHIINGVHYLTDKTADSWQTMAGSQLSVSLLDKSYFTIGQAKVIYPNILTNNGVMHIVDSVIMPPIGLF